MRTLISALAVASIMATSSAVLAADGMPVTPGAAGMATVVQINSQNDSGEHGTATLIQGPDGLEVHIKLIGTPEGVSQPAHIHVGTCATLNPSPMYPLALVTNGDSKTTLPNVKLADLMKSDFAINVHKSTTEIPKYVACGTIPKK